MRVSIYKIIIINIFCWFTCAQLLSQNLNLHLQLTSFKSLYDKQSNSESVPSSISNSQDEECRTAKIQVKAENYIDTERNLKYLLERTPNDICALLALTDLYYMQYRFEEGQQILDDAVALKSNYSVRLQKARYAINKMDFTGASNIYSQIVEEDSTSLEAIYGLANISYWLNNFMDSQNYLQKLISLDSTYAPAHLLYSKIHREWQNTAKWKQSIRNAVESDSLYAEARAAFASVLRNEGSPEQAHQQAHMALEIDPYCISAYQYLGNGGSLKSHDRFPGADDADSSFIKLLTQGNDHLLHHQYNKAKSSFDAALVFYPKDVTANMGIGIIHYFKGNYEIALSKFWNILEDYPHYGLAHYGISLVLKRKKDIVNIRLNDMLTSFNNRRTPPVPNHLRDVFLDYDRLDPELQKIILISAEPLSNYITALYISGATFQLIPFHNRLWELKHKAKTKNTHTFDLRLWDDVKGQGGFNAVGGEEWLREVKYQRWNILTHEFTHQVHGILSKKQRDQITVYFQKAKKERRTLDHYADFNEMEYLAQAVEAYIYDNKLADQKGTSGHTREILKAKDPSLYKFIENLNSSDSYRENEIRAYRRLGLNMIRNGNIPAAIETAQKGLFQYGNHPDLLGLLAQSYRLQGQYQKATQIDQQMVDLFSENLSGYAGLADDISFSAHDYSQAIKFLQSWNSEQNNSINDRYEYYIRLAQQYYNFGLFDKMETTIDSASIIITSPNPYTNIPNPWIMSAYGLLHRQYYQEAENKFLYSIDRIDRNDPDALAELSLIRLRSGDKQKGEEYLNTAKILDSDAARVQEIDALFFMNNGNDSKAKSILEKVIKNYPRRISSYILLSELYEPMNPKKSTKLLFEAHEIVSKKEPVLFIYRNNHFEPRGTLDKPFISQLYSKIAEESEKTGNIQEAIEYHTKALSYFKYNYDSYIALLKLNLNTGKAETANQVFNKLVKQSPPKRFIVIAKELLK